MSIGTLILIVLGIIVLVLLVLGFSIGWGNLWEKINIFGGGGSSIGDVVTACNLAVDTNNKYDYCENFRRIKIDGKTEYVNCEDGRVKTTVKSGISCSGTEAKDQCIKLITDAVNGKTGEDKVEACKEVSLKVNNNNCVSLAGQNYCENMNNQLSCKSLCENLDATQCGAKPNECSFTNSACKEKGTPCSEIETPQECNAKTNICVWR